MTEFKRVFVDTAPIIYYLENSSLYVDLIKRFFTKCIEDNIQIVTSSITVEKDLFTKLTGYIVIIDKKAYLAEKIN